MTMQASDTVRYKRRRFYLIDCEKDKSLINSADFGIEECGNVRCTANYGGYTARYFINRNRLSGIKYVDDYEVGKNNKFVGKSKRSKKLPLHYTGGIIIARFNERKYYNTDFIECLVSAEDAYELIVEDGIIIETIPLIEKMDNVNVVAWNKLKSEYDERSYKWREEK